MARKKGEKKAEVLQEEQAEQTIIHPTKDPTSRFAIDALLREHGFEIKSRPAGSQPVWEKRRGNSRVEFLQSEALKRIDPNDLEDAKYQIVLNGEGYD